MISFLLETEQVNRKSEEIKWYFDAEIKEYKSNMEWNPQTWIDLIVKSGRPTQECSQADFWKGFLTFVQA